MRFRLTVKDTPLRLMMKRLGEISGIRFVGGHDSLVVEVDGHSAESFKKTMGDHAIVTPL